LDIGVGVTCLIDEKFQGLIVIRFIC
jgi:hypothetical protein